ncbi:MAG: nickel pincer cofactor biosynthesis protein LarC, partial [Deltaproteobacteria bacterium]
QETRGTMTTNLHLDMVSGCAGDMLCAALCALGAGIEPLEQALDRMGVEASVALEPDEVNGIRCLRFRVEAREKPMHRRLVDIIDLLDRAGLAERPRRRAEAVFRRLAEAEAVVHGTTPEEIEFHEVGAIDSIADILGCALAIEQLTPDRITASTPLVGSGTVNSRHGKLPVPAPATLELLRGIEIRQLRVDGELTTPTGAALLREYCEFSGWPDMAVEKIGYGAGTRRYEDRPNVLRAVLGTCRSEESGQEVLIEANIDDMNPELFAHLMERLFSEGAHDVWLQPIMMKKSRPAVTLSILCPADKLDRMCAVVFAESTTIGVRWHTVQRRKLERSQQWVDTRWGRVRVKIAGEGGSALTASAEYEDCAELARRHGVPLRMVMDEALAAWRAGNR